MDLFPKSIYDIYLYVLKVGCNISLAKTYNDGYGTVYKFAVYTHTDNTNMAGSILLSDNKQSVYNAIGIDNIEYGSTESVFDTIKRMKDPLNRGF